MPRTNPQVEALRRENDILRRQMARMREDPGDIPFVACDNSCVVARPTGMATNGGCRCDASKLRRAVQWWRRRAVFLQITVQELRGLDGEARVSELEAEADESRATAEAMQSVADELRGENAALRAVAEAAQALLHGQNDWHIEDCHAYGAPDEECRDEAGPDPHCDCGAKAQRDALRATLAALPKKTDHG